MWWEVKVGTLDGLFVFFFFQFNQFALSKRIFKQEDFSLVRCLVGG